MNGANPLAGTYSISHVLVSVAGVPIDGWAEGDVITITPQGDRWKSKTGCSGEKMRSRLGNKGSDIKLSLMPSSLFNAALQTLLTTDQLTGLGCFPLMITILGSTGIPAATYIAPQAWIKKVPPIKAGEEFGTIEWDIEAAFGDQILSGMAPNPLG